MTTFSRREFLAATSGLAAAGLAGRWAWTKEILPDVRIARIVGFDVKSRRLKMVGKNSRLDVHGDHATDRMVRIYTTAGFEGVGNCRADECELRKLLGKSLADFYDSAATRMSVLGNGTMPLWDLAGRVLGKPVYELLGGKGPERVKVYDGSIYFADLLPENAARPLDRFKAEIDMGSRLGHRAFKIKIGRGAKWMQAAEGYQRDLDVLRTIRAHAGPEMVLGVDANNGYDLAGAKRLLGDLPDFNFAFVEELFPETIEDCIALKEFIRDRGWRTLLADGETQSELEAFKPFIEKRAIDVLQGDMNHFGFEGILTEAKWAEPAGIQVAPHNWGSLIGFYMQLHVGRAIANLYMAEHDPLSNEVIVAEGYEIKDGYCSVPAAPGFGLTIKEAKFRSDAQVRFDIRADRASAPVAVATRRRIYKACKWGMIEGAIDSLTRFEWCKELGFDGMEPVSPLNAELAKVQEASRLTGLPVHGVVNKQVNRRFRISSPDEATREKGRKLLEQSLRECYECGGDSVLLLPGKVGGPRNTHDNVWRRSIPQIRAVLPVASKLGVRILIENVWNGFCERPELMRDYIDEIDSPWVGSYFDIGNACRFARSERWIRILGRRIVKLDIKDWSKSKGLCDIGDGEVNWPAVREALAEVNFSGWATAEVRGGGRERLADIARRMDRVLDIS